MISTRIAGFLAAWWTIVPGHGAPGPGVAAPDRQPGVQNPAPPSRAGRDSALHLLNRIAYGPRPGDVDRVLAEGIDTYLERQLHPDRIPDPAVAAPLGRLAVLHAATGDLARQYRLDLADRLRRQRMLADSGAGAPPTEGRRPPVDATRRSIGELQQSVLIRAVLSERQLEAVLTDFWFNHFNVFMGKGPVRVLVRDYLEETIRPRVLGRFEDLLIATAESPAMLIYLDNAQSVAEGAEPPRLARRARLDSALEARMPRGVNENYARELLELHTLGVDAGYTQEDVENVARVLTGWGIRRRGAEPVFAFNAWAHDGGTKTVLGRVFPAGGGMEEGVELLRWLAAHPATVRHVSAKLCRRFVADDPPEGCIDAAAAAWQASDGEIRAVVAAILRSPEFWAPGTRGAKTKTPLEFVASAARVIGGVPDTTLVLAQVVRRLGQPLFFESAPTGYAEIEERWVNSGALLERLNVAMALASRRAPGLRSPGLPRRRIADPDALVQSVNETILGGQAGPATLRVLRERADTVDPARARILLTGLALGSPEFQRQ